MTKAARPAGQARRAATPEPAPEPSAAISLLAAEAPDAQALQMDARSNGRQEVLDIALLEASSELARHEAIVCEQEG